MNKKLLCLAALLFAAPAFADNCSGQYVNQAGTTNVVDMNNGNKVTFFNAPTTVSSTDTPYNGQGGCSGYVHEKDGKAWIANVCTLTSDNGDSWGYTGSEEVGSKQGKWTVTHGTGKFAKNAGSTGWYEATAQDGSAGKWGGNCSGVN